MNTKQHNEHLNNLYSFARKSFNSKKFKTPEVLLKVHRCPVCKKAVAEIKEIEFLKAMGECGTCDHVKGDIDEIRGQDWEA